MSAAQSSSSLPPAASSSSSSSSAATAGGAPAAAILSLDADENPNAASSGGTPQIITLVSKEGRRLPVSRSALMASELLKTTLEGDRDANEIPLYHIEGPIVQKVIDYLTYHSKVSDKRNPHPRRICLLDEIRND
jgi:hypothetical protein